MDDEKIKKNIQNIIDDFRENYQEYKKESEASIETRLIEPLFRLLDWTEKDFKKREHAQREGKRGFADYTFYIGDKKVFFLEVKKIGVPLDKEADTQVISYALSKSVPIAISTNFEELKVFCVEEENVSKRKIIVFNKPEEYTENIHDFVLLSKSSFEQNLLLKKAENLGLLKKRITIDKPLLDDLILIRKFIADDIEKSYPDKYQPNEKEEITQRIIDRLIFIRKCEDTGINPDNLILKDAIAVPDNKAYSKLKEIFEKYNEVYNSGLFAIDKDNECDKITINGEIIKKLINYLYTSKNGGYVYNFEWISADILGQVYEQYLGMILEQTKSGKSKLKNGQAHRKEQGIYYTPTYIVDYIVKNTVGELLKNKKIKAKEIKIVDPACGSGSFLIKAFDYLYDNLSISKDSKQYRIDSQGKYSIKTEILKNNLYGVDLDNKAVEITKLNLLLKAAEKNRRLPEEIDLHIRHGNSLINDETIAILDAFQWIGDFQEGCFDVVIGNPPYVRNDTLPKTDKQYFMNKYHSTIGKFDLYLVFIEKALRLLKENGYLGFIVPSKFMAADYGAKLRSFLLENSLILQIIDVSNLPVFEGVATYPCIIILQKKKTKSKKHNIKIASQIKSVEDFKNITKKYSLLPQQKYESNSKNIFTLSTDKSSENLLSKIKGKNATLLEICEIKAGIHNGNIREKLITEKQEDGFCKKLLLGSDIDRYSKSCRKLYIRYNPKIIDKDEGEYCSLREERIFTSKEKILVRDIGKRLPATYDDEQFYCMDTIYIILLRDSFKDKFDLKYILAVLNSSLIDFYFRKIFGTVHVGSNYQRYKRQFLVDLPIKSVSTTQQEQIVKCVDKILFFKKRLNKIGDKKTSESAKLEEEIKNIDKQIDEIVYKLYGLTKEEIAIVEESLK